MNATQETTQRHAADLLARDGVVGVCTGPKMRAGRPTGQQAVVCLVNAKGQATPGEEIPRDLNGAPTDVVEAPLEWLKAALPDYRAMSRPVCVGHSVGLTKSGQSGTCGGYYIYAHVAYMLTAGHVVGDVDEAEVSQPGGKCQVVAGANKYGIGWVYGGNVALPWKSDADAAAMILRDHSDCLLAIQHYDAVSDQYKTPPVLFQPSFKGAHYSTLPAFAGHKHPHLVGDAQPGDMVTILGAVTGGCTAQVFATDLQVSTRYPSADGWKPVNLTGLHAYLSFGESTIVRPGDSGALAYNATGKGVSSVVMGSGRFAVGIPLVRQLRALHGDVEVVV